MVTTLALLGPVGYVWQNSLVPDTYSVMEIGYSDHGGKAGEASAPEDDSTSVATLTGPRDVPADVSFTLIAREKQLKLADGSTTASYTLNDASPGPQIRAIQGQLVEVRLVNESVDDGVTLHWHGLDVPNAEDGVAGVTQDAVAAGREHVYRFVAEHPGTYWYHSHQKAHEQVHLGLFGTLVITPAATDPTPAALDAVAAVHTYDGRRTVAGRSGVTVLQASPGALVRTRVINTDQGAVRAAVTGAPYQVVAVDGHDVLGPKPLTGIAVPVAAGGRVDLEFTVPRVGAVRVDFGAGATLLFGAVDAPQRGQALPAPTLDLLSYGTPAPIGFDATKPDRRFAYRIGRRPGLLDGRPGLWWTINGSSYPDVPVYVVSRGDVVTITVANTTTEAHPVHLHGHHAVVLSRNGVVATGSPWWVDSLNVGGGETYEIAFVADNPGIWAMHCGNFPHAAHGLVTHLAYTGVSSPYQIGGKAGNRPA